MPGVPKIWAIRGPSTSGTEVRNGATVLYGNASNTRVVTNAQSSISLVSVDHGPNINYTTKDTGAAGASGWTTIVSSGTYGLVTAQQYQIPQLKSSMKLAGLNTTLLNTTGGDFGNRKSINFKTTTQTIRMVQQGWNYVTGKFLAISGNVAPVSASDNFNTDYAAIPTRALPGQLVFLDAGKTISSGYYRAKTD